MSLSEVYQSADNARYMLSLESSRDAISSVVLVMQAEVGICLFLSVQSVCAIWSHEVKKDAQHVVMVVISR